MAKNLQPQERGSIPPTDLHYTRFPKDARAQRGMREGDFDNGPKKKIVGRPPLHEEKMARGI